MYSDLIGEVRSLRREDALSRDEWFRKLEVPSKGQIVFELDTLLRAIGAYANPRNHPGPARRTTPVVAQDFREQLVFAAEGLERLVEVGRSLLPQDRERTRVFQEYIESLPEFSTGTSKRPLGIDASTPPISSGSAPITGPLDGADGPERALAVLRHALTNFHEIAAGLARLQRVTFRLFHATLVTSEREIARSRFFAPLSPLEFRPEYDRIESAQIMELTRTVPGESARQLVALTFLSLFRLLRYVDLADEVMRRPEDPTVRGTVYLVLSVLRTDARALTDELRLRAGRHLADGYERSLFRVHAREVGRRFDALRADGHRMLEVKAALEGVAANLRLELRRTFEHDLPAPELAPSIEVLRERVLAVAGNLRPALQNAILFLGKSLGARLDEKGVFDDKAAKRNLSERLRRDVWMFAQIVRAFTDKARAAKGEEVPWTGASPLQFVREFLRYFRSMGVPLLRAADYPRVDAFIQAMGSLEESDLVDPRKLEQALAEATQFQGFLTELFEQIGKRDELAGTTFDKRAAADALRLYLGGPD